MYLKMIIFLKIKLMMSALILGVFLPYRYIKDILLISTPCFYWQKIVGEDALASLYFSDPSYLENIKTRKQQEKQKNFVAIEIEV